MKNYATLTGRGELMLFTAKNDIEANYICRGRRYKELSISVSNRVKGVDELFGIERELYNELKTL